MKSNLGRKCKHRLTPEIYTFQKWSGKKAIVEDINGNIHVFEAHYITFLEPLNEI